MRQAGNATFQLLLSPGVNCPAVSLTQSGKGRSGAPLLAQGHKLLWEHGVAALRHEAGPESGALLSHGAGARRQLLKPFDGLQRKSQAVFLPDEAFCQRETLNGLMLVAYGGGFYLNDDSLGCPSEGQNNDGDGGEYGPHDDQALVFFLLGSLTAARLRSVCAFPL